MSKPRPRLWPLSQIPWQDSTTRSPPGPRLSPGIFVFLHAFAVFACKIRKSCCPNAMFSFCSQPNIPGLHGTPYHRLFHIPMVGSQTGFPLLRSSHVIFPQARSGDPAIHCIGQSSLGIPGEINQLRHWVSITRRPQPAAMHQNRCMFFRNTVWPRGFIRSRPVQSGGVSTVHPYRGHCDS